MEKIIVFWGAGLYGKKAFERLQAEVQQKIVFCDNDSRRWNTLYCGKRIATIQEVQEFWESGSLDTLVLTVARWEDIFLQCIDMGITKDKIKIFDANGGKMCELDETYRQNVYSQDGEELFLREVFQSKKKGFYVDIGANHPYRFSNTLWAYQKGWRGINVEPGIKNYKLLEVLRSEDININCGISNQEGELIYYEFEENGLNTFDKEEAEKLGNYINVRSVPVCKLDSIFKRYKVHEVDFLDIDVEGTELQVLESIDWEKINVKFILLEQRGLTLKGVLQSQEYKFLTNMGYEAIGKFDRTVIYEKKEVNFN